MSELNISLSSLGGLWQQYFIEGLSDQTNDLLESSRRLWGSWCLSRKIDPISGGVNCVLEFLSNLFSEGLEHRTINGYRSAILAYHEKGERISIGQYPKVCELLSGDFNKRPPQPKYTVIWDIDSEVFDYISTLGNNESLSKKKNYIKADNIVGYSLIKQGLRINLFGHYTYCVQGNLSNFSF